jgi:recombination protein RecT
VLPSHVSVRAWLATAIAALRREPKLWAAAASDTDALLIALFRAAQMGLEPGTEQYYLTVRKGKIQGIPGYQGEIEMIYRAGAVASVVVQIVYQNDQFSWDPKTKLPPSHTGPGGDWFADRGPARGVYAYALMKDGAVSNVVILGPGDIAKIRAASDGAGTGWSPWNQWEDSMWLKSAAHRLRKWVPTSSEYVGGQARAIAGAQADVRGRAAIPEQFVAAAIEHDDDVSTPPRGLPQARVDDVPAVEAGEYDPTVAEDWQPAN